MTKITKEQLAKAVASSFSYSQVLKTLGQHGAGGSIDRIRKRIIRLAIPTMHFHIKGASVNCPTCGLQVKAKGLYCHITVFHKQTEEVRKARVKNAVRTKKDTGWQPWNKGLSILKNPELTDKLRKATLVSKAARKKLPKRVHSAERKKRMSAYRKQLHKDHPELHPNRILARNKKFASYPEQLAEIFFTNHGIAFERQKKVLSFYPDFVLKDKHIIEIDGERWHGSKEAKEKDRLRDKKLSEAGYKVTRIPATAVLKNLETIFSGI